MSERRTRFVFGLAGITVLLLAPLATPSARCERVAGEELDRYYGNWERALHRKRETVRKVVPTPTVFNKHDFFPKTQEAGGSYIVVGGKKVLVRAPRREPSTAPATADSATAESVGQASAEVSAASRVGQAPNVPTPIPALVKINVARVVDGKIITEEALVTPTPVPAKPVVVSTSSAPTRQLSGEMAAIREKLIQASVVSGKPTHFQQKEISAILKEFMRLRKENKDIDTLLPKERASSIQGKLIRLTSAAQGSNIQPAIAKALLDVLFPEKPGQPVSAGVSASAGQGGVPNAVQGAGVEAGQAGEGATVEAEEPQIYVDPQTGQQFYSDGTPVYVEESQEYEQPNSAEDQGELQEGEEQYIQEDVNNNGGEVYSEESPRDDGSQSEEVR